MKKLILSVLFINILLSLTAQNVGIGTSTPKARLHVADSSVVFTANKTLPFPAGAAPVSGEGSRMMWYADKAAFRVGNVSYTDVFEDGTHFWDSDSIGNYSFASGYNTKAKGIYSTAMGFESYAADFSTCLGYVSHASAPMSTAVGIFARAENTWSAAYGRGTASGLGSFASGYDVWAAGDFSTALGYRSKAAGVLSTATGDSTHAKSYASFSLGRYNDTIAGSSPAAWVATDPLLYIGNGSDNNNRSNAAVVYKNGNVDINGYTQLGKTSESAPSIKMKKITGVSNSAQNNWVNIPHGLTQSKILAVDIIMIVPGFVNLPPSYTYQAGYEFQYQVSSIYIVVINSAANSANILSKNFTILITYEE